MSRNSFFAKSLRFIGIVLMGLTGGFTLLGGIGTTCAALFPTKWDSMAPLASFQWLYILFVILGIAIGVWGIRATVKLIRRTSDSYVTSIRALIAGMLIGGLHIYISRLLRGKSMPVDAVVYTTVLTLAVFLLLRIPWIWQGVNFEKGASKSNKMAGGAAALLLGLLTLTIQYTMGPTHTWDGVNYANAFNAAMTVAGIGLLLLGAGIFVSARTVKMTAGRLIVQKRDHTYITEFAYLLREDGHPAWVELDQHICGLFPRAEWLSLLRDVGFQPEIIQDTYDRDLFLARRPRDWKRRDL